MCNVCKDIELLSIDEWKIRQREFLLIFLLSDDLELCDVGQHCTQLQTPVHSHFVLEPLNAVRRETTLILFLFQKRRDYSVIVEVFSRIVEKVLVPLKRRLITKYTHPNRVREYA